MSDIDALESLRGRFLARAGEDLAGLKSHLDGGHPLDATALRFTVHRLAGSAGTFGYGEVSEAAALAEDDLLDGNENLDASLRRLVGLLDAMIRERA